MFLGLDDWKIDVVCCPGTLDRFILVFVDTLVKDVVYIVVVIP